MKATSRRKAGGRANAEAGDRAEAAGTGRAKAGGRAKAAKGPSGRAARVARAKPTRPGQAKAAGEHGAVASTSGSPVRHRDVDAELAGQRLDNFLLANLKGVPRSHVYQLIRSGQVRVNSGRSTASYRLLEGDKVRVPPVRTRDPAPVSGRKGSVEWLRDRIVYEDARLIVVDKPAGLAVHGGSGINMGCIEALRVLRPEQKTLELVHRLDRGTSGCLLVAKRRSALRALHGVIREGKLEKRYLALLKGSWEHGKVEIDAPLTARRREGEVKVKVDESGKASRSLFRRVDGFGTLASLVEVVLLTGRTHQIRVHAAHAGHPIAGDDRYGDKDFNGAMEAYGLHRIFLHAHSIAFRWPDSDEELAVSVPLPQELAAVVQSLTEQNRRVVSKDRARQKDRSSLKGRGAPKGRGRHA